VNALSATIDQPRRWLHVACLLAVVVVYGALAIIPRTFPVMFLDRAGEVTYGRENGKSYIEFEVTAYKLRQCPPLFPDQRTIQRDGKDVQQQLGAIRGAKGVYREAWMEFIADESPNSSKPRSWFEPASFGVWRFWLPSRLTPPPVSARLPVIHSCGEDHDIPIASLMGPFRLPVPSDQGPPVESE